MVGVVQVLVDRFPGRHVAVQEDVFDGEGTLFHVPVTDELEGAALAGAVTTGAILMDERCDVLVEGDLGRQGASDAKEEEGKRDSNHGWVGRGIP